MFNPQTQDDLEALVEEALGSAKRPFASIEDVTAVLRITYLTRDHTRITTYLTLPKDFQVCIEEKEAAR